MRNIQIPATLLELLRQTKASRHTADNAYIICQPDSSPYKSDSLSLKCRKFLKANNLKHIRFHDLRYINATIMLTSGIYPKVAQERIGHANYQITLPILNSNTKTNKIA